MWALHWLTSADWRGRQCQQQRSCIDEPVHGSTGILVPGLSTFPLPQVSPVPTIAQGNHTSAQIRTQKCLDVDHCPLLTLCGPALACFGQPSPVTGRLSAFETALLCVRWNAHSRERHTHGSWATRQRKSAGDCGRRRPFDRDDSASKALHNLSGCDRNTRHALVRIRSKLIPKGLHVSR